MITINTHHHRRGQTLTEVAILIALIATSVGVVMAVLGVSVRDLYCSVVGGFGLEPQACQSHIVWSEDFSDFKRWSITHGKNWTLKNGILHVGPGGEHRAFTGEESWSDYTINLGYPQLNKGRGFGVYFRVSDEPKINGYAFQYDPGYNRSFIIRKIVNGRELWPPIAVSRAPADFAWWGTPHEISIQVDGDTFTAYVDGNAVVKATDDSFRHGRVGLRTWGKNQASFDDLTVTRP